MSETTQEADRIPLCSSLAQHAKYAAERCQAHDCDMSNMCRQTILRFARCVGLRALHTA